MKEELICEICKALIKRVDSYKLTKYEYRTIVYSLYDLDVENLIIYKKQLTELGFIGLNL